MAWLALLMAMAMGGCATTRTDADPMLALLQSRGLAPAASPSADAAGSRLVVAAMSYLDVQYRFGGNSADEGFDCSGFTRHVFAQVLGLQLPRQAADQARRGGLRRVEHDDLLPGDLVFFNTQRRTYSHVGIYIGDGRFVHSPRAGQQVRVEQMSAGYWARRFDGARRAPGV
jgi:cell wall-associated NlpC family hydrolase